MRIVNKEEFLALPEGTLYSEYEPCVFYGLGVKGKSIPNDFFEMQLIGNVKTSDVGDDAPAILETARTEKTSFALDFDCEGRDGAFKYDQLYAVYEKGDIEQLIKRLRKCLTAEK